MIGRLLGGIATSLLFSAFESWAVAAHNAAGFEESLLSDLFTKAVFLGNGLMAIASGLLGNVLVEDFKLGPVAPFDAAIVVLLAGGVAIQLTWAENYGNKGSDMAKMLGAQFSQALQTIRSGARRLPIGRLNAVWCSWGCAFGASNTLACIWRATAVFASHEQQGHAVVCCAVLFCAVVADARVALLGASQALFEASMYTFVFLWTPALSPAGEKLPHGFIFAIFMTASMVGTALAGRLVRSMPLELLMQVNWGIVGLKV
jgi:hypothetical protein